MKAKTVVVIFLSSFSTLAYEIVLTRIFSISLSYHFAFMIISIAMLGLGASGTILSLFPGLKDPSRMGIETLLLGMSIPLSYLVVRAVPFDPVKLLWAKTQLLYVLFYYLVLSIPFFFTGLIVAKAFTSFSEKSSLLYGGDLLGAGAGSMALLSLMTVAAPDQTVFVISSVALLSPLILGGKRLKVASLVLIVISLSLFILHPLWMHPRISPYKGLQVALRSPEAQLLKTEYNPFSRIDFFKSPAVRFAPGLSLKYLDPLPGQIGFSIDGGEINAVTDPAGSGSLDFLRYLPSSLPYEIGRRDKALVLDPRGGLRILMAMTYGSKNIYKVESHPFLIEAIRWDLKGFSGGIYSDHVWLGLGRSFLRSRGERFDLIDLSLMGAFPSGSFGIAEDYRYTVEAFREYLRHLKEEGILSISLFLLPPPRMELRLLHTIAVAMNEIGIEDAERRVVAIRSWGSMTLLAKPSPFTHRELEVVRSFSKDRGFDLVYTPGIKDEETGRYIRGPSKEYTAAFRQILNPETRSTFIDHYLFDIQAVRDENPFFHYFLRLRNIRGIYERMGEKWQYFMEEGYLLPAVFVQVLFLTLLLISLPALTMKKDKVEAEKRDLSKRRLSLDLNLFYFAFLGIGFMFVEVSVLQKMILPLQNPSYAVATVLASILISSGTGSLLSSWIRRLRTPSTAIVISMIVAAYSFLLPSFSEVILSLSMPLKILLVFLILLPLGLFMGIPFPAGIKVLGESRPSHIPWAWAINGCFSILSPLLAIMLAMDVGFRSVLWAGAGAYLLAFLTFPSQSRRSLGRRRPDPSAPHGAHRSLL
jgi:hypothetical protein